MLPIKRDQKGGNTYGQYTKVWLALPKADVLDGDVDGFSVFGVLKIVSSFLENLGLCLVPPGQINRQEWQR